MTGSAGTRVAARLLMCWVALPVIGCSKADPAPTDKPKPAEPAADDKTAAPAADDTAAEPAADDKPTAPAADDKTAAPAADDKPSEGPSPARPPARDGTVWVTGTVNNLGGRQRGPRTDVTEVCVFEQGDLPCVKTDDKGMFAIETPKLAEVALLFRGEKLVPTLRAFVTTDAPLELGNTRVANEPGLAPIAKAQGKPFHAKQGGVFFGGLPEVNATLDPSSGERFFINMRGDVVEGAKAIPMHGSGGFYNVKPGLVRVRFSFPGGNCRYNPENTFAGWPDADDPGVARIPVRPGHLTHMVSMYCGTDVPAATANGRADEGGRPVTAPASTK